MSFKRRPIEITHPRTSGDSHFQAFARNSLISVKKTVNGDSLPLLGGAGHR